MKKLIAIFMVTMMLVLAVGCSSNKGKRDPVLSEDLTKVLEKIYDTADLDDELKDYFKDYEQVKLDESNVESYLGSSDIKFKEGLCSVPMMNAIPYQLVLVRLDENADVEAVNANPRKWVCVEADEVDVESIDNTILFLMGEKQDATPIKEAFMNLAEAK